ncbi:MAG: metal ABC transporter substrate-binding protein [Promethearchaeota archaeon]
MKKMYFLISIIIIFGSIVQVKNIKVENNLKISADPQIQVVATTTILRDFVQEIIGEQGKVTVIIEEGMCPGHYDYTPSDINLVSNADIVFYHGFEWDQFLEALLSAAENKKAAYSISGNGSLGFTQWGSPANVPLFLDVICDYLNETYPLLNETFNQNCAHYKTEVALKKAEIEDQNTKLYNFTNVKAYIMMHQTAFMTWLGFNITGSWSKDDNSMTPSDLSTIIDEAEQTGTEIIIMNYQSGTEQGKEAADYLGIPSVPLQNFPGLYGIDTYLDQLDFNVALLNWALNDGPDPRVSTSSRIGSDLLIPIGAFIFIGAILVIYRKQQYLKK